MNATEITAGSDLLHTLAHITNRDHAGRHFTEIYDEETLDALETAGLVEISRPIHEPSGIPYSQEYWKLEPTESARQLVSNLYDEQDYEYP